MYCAELLRSVPHRPGAARRSVFTCRQAAALILAALVRRPRFWKEKTEVESKFAHYQRPCLILTEVVALDSNAAPFAIVPQRTICAFLAMFSARELIARTRKHATAPILSEKTVILSAA